MPLALGLLFLFGCDSHFDDTDLVCLDEADAVITADGAYACARIPEWIVADAHGTPCDEPFAAAPAGSGRPTHCSLAAALARAADAGDPSPADGRLDIVVLGKGASLACEPGPDATLASSEILTITNPGASALNVIGCGIRLENAASGAPALRIAGSVGAVSLINVELHGGGGPALVVEGNRGGVTLAGIRIPNGAAGIDIAGQTSPVTISGGTIGPVATTAIDARGLARLDLIDTTLASDAGPVVSLTDVGGLLIANSAITASANAAVALLLEKLHGEARLRDSVLTASAGDAIRLRNSAGGLWLEIRDTTIHFGEGGDGGAGLNIELTGQAAVTARLRGARMHGKGGTAVVASENGDAQLRLNIRRGALLGGAAGIDLDMRQRSTLAFEASQITEFGGYDGHPIDIQASDASRLEAQFIGVHVRGSRLGSGLRLDLRDSARGRVRVDDSVFEEIETGDGITAATRGASAALDLEISGSRIDLADTARDGVSIESGDDRAGESTVCVDLTDNDIRAGRSRVGVRLHQSGTARLMLKNAGPGDDPLSSLTRENRLSPNPASLEGQLGTDELTRCPG